MLKHVSRTHRINLDWLFERMEPDNDIHGRYIHTKLQIADMLTKGNFTEELWLNLCHLIRLGPPPKRTQPRETTYIARIGATSPGASTRDFIAIASLTSTTSSMPRRNQMASSQWRWQ